MSDPKLPIPVVLVVDDEALIRWSLSEALAEAGYTVMSAMSGAEVRRAIARDPCLPLVVLLDLRLPDVVDLTLLEDIRRVRPDAPVVIMTAHGTPDDAARAHELGAFDFVTKPFDVAEMVGLVGRASTRTFGYISRDAPPADGGR
jgi:DNA-binding NtrC family response regulator